MIFLPTFYVTIGFYRLLPATFTNGDVANYDSQAVIRQIVDRWLCDNRGVSLLRPCICSRRGEFGICSDHLVAHYVAVCCHERMLVRTSKSVLRA